MERATLVGPKCGARKRYTVGGEAHERETGDPCCSTTASLGISGGRMEGGGGEKKRSSGYHELLLLQPLLLVDGEQ